MTEYTITDGAGTEAVIVPEKGATVISLKRNGQEYLFRDNENLVSDERPRCGIPFLFPIFGRLRNDTFSWEGKTYCMDIHGFAHTSRWSVVGSARNMLALELRATEETLRQYPFRFYIRLVFSVSDGAISIYQTYRNDGQTEMPFQHGFHPYFHTEGMAHAMLEVNADRYLEHATGIVRKPVSGEFPVSSPEEGVPNGTTFSAVQSPVVLHLPKEQRKIALNFGRGYQDLVLWSRPGYPFLCVEPISGKPDGLNCGDCKTLLPGQIWNSLVKISVA